MKKALPQTTTQGKWIHCPKVMRKQGTLARLLLAPSQTMKTRITKHENTNDGKPNKKMFTRVLEMRKASSPSAGRTQISNVFDQVSAPCTSSAESLKQYEGLLPEALQGNTQGGGGGGPRMRPPNVNMDEPSTAREEKVRVRNV